MKIIVNGATYTRLRNLRYAPEVDITGASLPVSEFSADIDTRNGVVLGEQVEVQPDDVPSVDGILAVGEMAELRDDLGQLWAKYWIVYAEVVAGGFVRVRAQSKLCLLDRQRVPAVMYGQEEVYQLLTGLLGLALGSGDYLVDVTLGELEVSGYCPEQTIRERLLNVCMAAGLFVTAHADGRILVTAWPTGSTLVPVEDTYWRPAVTWRDHVTAVRAKSYTFSTGTPQQGDVTVTAGGTTYIVTAQDVRLSNPRAPETAPENVVDVSSCMLINSSNVDDVLSRLSMVHFLRMEVEAGVLDNHQYTPGDKLKIYTGPDEMAEGYVQRLSYTFGVQAKAQMTLVGCAGVACGTLTVLCQWDGVTLSRRVYAFPVGYAYNLANPYLDKTMNGHRYIFRPTTAAVTGTMTAQGVAATVQYSEALDAYKNEQGKRILHVLSVDSLTESTVGTAAVVAIG